VEILVVDGESEDGTRAIAESHQGPIRVLSNPARTAPAALNIESWRPAAMSLPVWMRTRRIHPSISRASSKRWS